MKAGLPTAFTSSPRLSRNPTIMQRFSPAWMPLCCLPAMSHSESWPWRHGPPGSRLLPLPLVDYGILSRIRRTA